MPYTGIGYGSGITANTNRGPSNQIWGGIPVLEIIENPQKGLYFFDDFLDLPFAPTLTTEIGYGRYKGFADNGSIATAFSINSVITPGGICVFTQTVTTANKQNVLGTCASPFQMNPAGGKLAFEARVFCSQILTNDGQFFVGLAENQTMAFANAVPLTDTNALATTGAMVGFNRLEDGLGVLNASYTDHAAAWTNVKASVGAITAYGWVKLGMVYDPSDTTNTLRFFVNGIPSTTVVSQATLTALTYLDNVGLGPCMAFYTDTANLATTCGIDWWRCAMLYDV